MKALEIWNTAKEKLVAQGRSVGAIDAASSGFAGGLRAAACEVLTHAKDVINDDSAGRLYIRLMAAADKIEGVR